MVCSTTHEVWLAIKVEKDKNYGIILESVPKCYLVCTKICFGEVQWRNYVSCAYSSLRLSFIGFSYMEGFSLLFDFYRLSLA